jgi:hypothetical protein
MAYVCKNQTVFNAAYTAALAAMNVSSRSYSPSTLSAYYYNLAAVAGAFAQEFDTLYTASAIPSCVELSLLRDAIGSLWEEIAPPTESARSLDPTTYTSMCNAILAMLTAASAYWVSQGIVAGPASALPVLGKQKTVVSGALTPLLSVDMADPVTADSWGGMMQFNCECTNGTDVQIREGNANVAIAYKPSTLTFYEAAAALLQTIAVSAGTLVFTFSWTNVGTVATLNVTCTSSLAVPTSFLFNYSISFASHPTAIYL